MFALWRIATILTGYVAAVFIAIVGLYLFIEILGWVTRPAGYPSSPSPPMTVEYFWNAAFVLFQNFFLMGAGITAAPAFVMVVISELRSWRAIRFYAFGGAGVGVACHLVLLFSLLMSRGIPPNWADRIFLIASLLPVMVTGAMAGAVYWLIAGRNAGRWRRDTAELAKT